MYQIKNNAQQTWMYYKHVLEAACLTKHNACKVVGSCQSFIFAKYNIKNKVSLPVSMAVWPP